MSPRLTTSLWPADTSRAILAITAGEALRRAAAQVPDRLALIEAMPEDMASLTGASARDRRWTFAGLLADAEACAHWLLQRFQPGEHVCVWAPNVPEWVIIQYGAALAGLVLVTANPALREEELRHVLRRSRAVGLIHVETFRGTDMGAVARALDCEVRERIGIADLERQLASFFGREALPRMSPQSAAQIQFTSGTTGLPKAAMLHHQGLVTNAAFTAERLGQHDDIVVTPMPLFHTAGSVLGVLGCATTLSTLVLPTLFDPKLMLSIIQRERATVVIGVPTMLAAMLQELDNEPYDLGSVKIALSGGASIPPDLHERVEGHFSCPLVTLYGQTELSPSVCATGPDDAVEDRAHTSGRPLPQVEVRIIDSRTGEITAIGQEGEVQARGYQVMLGYFGQEEAIEATILPDGWLRTGDVGRLDERGFLTITGRLSDMIIRGGENLYPAEIEASLIRHPAVMEAAVFGLPDDHWGEIVAAALRLDPAEKDVTADALKHHCRDQLAPHKTPSQWYVLDALPLTASGKVQKYRLREQALQGGLGKLEDGKPLLPAGIASASGSF